MNTRDTTGRLKEIKIQRKKPEFSQKSNIFIRHYNKFFLVKQL